MELSSTTLVHEQEVAKQALASATTSQLAESSERATGEDNNEVAALPH
jgi:hypothetical protein